MSTKPSAEAVLHDLVTDLLLIQIGTRMFWRTDDQLRADRFAWYVHGELVDVAKKMGWAHDVEDVWNGELPG